MAKNRKRIEILNQGIKTLKANEEGLKTKKIDPDDALAEITQMLQTIQAETEARAYDKTFQQYGKYKQQVNDLKRKVEGETSKDNKEFTDGNRDETSDNQRAIKNVHDFSKTWYQKKLIPDSELVEYFDAEREQLVTEIKKALEELKKENK